MRYAWLFALLVPSLIAQAETPPPTPKEQPTIGSWGLFVDPAGDCQAQEADGKLTITAPGTEHNLNPTVFFKNVLGPRVLQPVEGDFLVQVMVCRFPRPASKTASDRKGNSFVSEGLLVWKDDKSFVRFMRGDLGEREAPFTHLEAFDKAKRLKSEFQIQKIEDATIPDEALWLRIERKGDTLTLSRSLDGQMWEPFATQTLAQWPERLTLGVGAVNATNKEFAPQFERFELRQEAVED